MARFVKPSKKAHEPDPHRIARAKARNAEIKEIEDDRPEWYKGKSETGLSHEHTEGWIDDVGDLPPGVTP